MGSRKIDENVLLRAWTGCDLDGVMMVQAVRLSQSYDLDPTHSYKTTFSLYLTLFPSVPCLALEIYVV